MTLATVRAYVWKTGGDVLLYYKSNGRKPELEQRHAEAKAKAEEEEVRREAEASAAKRGDEMQGGTAVTA